MVGQLEYREGASEVSWILSLINALYGSKVIFAGYTVSQIIALLTSDAAKKALAVAEGVVEEYKKNGAPGLVAGINFLASVARVHNMTPSEQKIWMERGMFAANENNDFPQQVSNG